MLHKKAIVFLTFFLALVGYSTVAFATTCEELAGEVEFEFCEEIDMEQLVDTSNPEAIREMYNIQSEYDEETETLYVSTEMTAPEGRYIPVNPNGGHWDSVEELNDFLNVMLGTEELDFVVDTCDPSLQIQVEQEFETRRFNPNTGEFQDSIDLVIDATSSWDRTWEVEDAVISFEGTGNHCVDGNDSDELKNRQCSRAYQTEFQDPNTAVCDELMGPRIQDNFVETKVDVKEFMGMTGGHYHAGAMAGVHADIGIHNEYFNDAGGLLYPELSPQTWKPTKTLSERGPDGVCGYGKTSRDEYEIVLTTSADMPKSSCTTNPFGAPQN